MAPEELPGGKTQPLAQPQDVIRAEDNGGFLAAAIEAGQTGMAMKAENTVRREGGPGFSIVRFLIEGYH
jgi:hypothetical protein